MQTRESIDNQIKALKAPYIFWTRKEIGALPEILADDERIKALTSGIVGNRTWLVVCTDRRLIFLNHGMILGVQQTQIPLDRVQTIDHEFLIAFGSISVYDGVHVTKVGLVLQSAILPFVKATQEAIHEYRQKLASGAKNESVDIASQIEKLARLKENGYITEDEFQHQKRKLLG